MRNILIAGGAGFIGSHLCKRLLHKGNRIVCIDNFCTGSPDNVAMFTGNPYFELIEHDITLPYDTAGHIDEIYNLACPASPKHYQDTPIATTKTLVLGTFNLLELAEKIIAFTSSRSSITKSPLPPDDPCRRCPDISLATKNLNGWTPRIDIENGLKKTIAYFKSKTK